MAREHEDKVIDGNRDMNGCPPENRSGVKWNDGRMITSR
jgi:hypothetical protein